MNELKGVVSDVTHPRGYDVVWRLWIDVAELRLRRSKEEQDDHLVELMNDIIDEPGGYREDRDALSVLSLIHI